MMNPRKISFLQWNCRGLRANFDELQILLQKYCPAVICLQETFLNDTSLSLKCYSMFHILNPEGNGGGVSIAVDNTVPHSQVQLDTQLQAVAVQLSIPHSITICSLYLPPHLKWTEDEITTLIHQLPEPYLLVGDFNAHSTLWGCSSTDRKGHCIETLLTEQDICLLNQKLPTYIHPATGSQSALDLSLCHPNIFLDFTWQVLDDTHGSDHFPIVLETSQNISPDSMKRWSLNRANWTLFQTLCSNTIDVATLLASGDPLSSFTSLVFAAAEAAIPRTSTVPKHINKPWFNEECKNAVSDRKKALNKLKTNPMPVNLDNYKLCRARTRKIIRSTKRQSWKNYVSQLNQRTPMKKVWKMVKKICGKNTASSIKHVCKNGKTVTDSSAIADTLGEAFANNSSSTHYSTKFNVFKNKMEKIPLQFTSDNDELYNKLFTLSEMQESLQRAHDSSPGPDNIHYQIIKHLPESSLKTLLDIFNHIWESGIFPPSWQEATIVPIPKPGKDHSDPMNYRPIALTSCVCKTMERMVNSRLMWYLEVNHILTPNQSGFRKRRSTVDQLVRLESLIREAFVKKQHVVAVFFDIEKAYDTTWKYGIMKDLFDAGLRGRLTSFVEGFLSDRLFKVRVGNTFSKFFSQENGVPQGCILSTTLFLLKINSIMKCLSNNINSSLYVDDFLICYSSAHMATIERQLQHCLNKLQIWCDENGFKFSTAKTVCMHFCQKRGIHLDPDLHLHGVPIPVVTEYKFLGLIFDSKLTFYPHIKYLKQKGIQALNLLRVVAHTDWGADRTVLIQLYKAVIRAKLDYGAIIYGSARPSYLKILDPIQNQALRLCLGAFRTSPVASLEVEANIPSLSLRRTKLALQYVTQLKANPSNPAYNCVFSLKCQQAFNCRPHVIPPFGIRMLPYIADLDIDLQCIAPVKVCPIPPWILKQPHIILDLHNNLKADTCPDIMRSRFLELMHHFQASVPIYTDGSKSDEAVAAAAVSQQQSLSLRLPHEASIFSAELKGLSLALDIVKRFKYTDVIIFSDSLSVIQAIASQKLLNPLVLEVVLKFHYCVSSGTHVSLCWVPSHIGIKGNERADAAAKAALTLDIAFVKIPHSDVKPCIDKYINQMWQQTWQSQNNNKLYSIKPCIGKSIYPSLFSRRDEVVWARIRIGHSHVTHSHLLKKEAVPMCISCNCMYTVEHILISCVNFAIIRNKYYSVLSLTDLFSKIRPSQVLLYLKDIQLYKKI
jgi:ribonuclease HI